MERQQQAKRQLVALSREQQVQAQWNDHGERSDELPAEHGSEASDGESAQLQLASKEEEELPPPPSPRACRRRRDRSNGGQPAYLRSSSLVPLDGLDGLH